MMREWPFSIEHSQGNFIYLAGRTGRKQHNPAASFFFIGAAAGEVQLQEKCKTFYHAAVKGFIDKIVIDTEKFRPEQQRATQSPPQRPKPAGKHYKMIPPFSILQKPSLMAPAFLLL